MVNVFGLGGLRFRIGHDTISEVELHPIWDLLLHELPFGVRLDEVIRIV